MGISHTGITVHGVGGSELLHSSSEFTVLLPIITGDMSTDIIKVASAVLAGRNGSLIVLGTIEVPEDISLSTGALQARGYRRFLENLNLFDKNQTIEIRNLVKVSRRVWDAINDTARDENCNLLIVPWPDSQKENYLYNIGISEVVEKSPIDTIIVKPGQRQSLKKILVPLRGMPHANLIADTALAVSHKFNAELTIMHILSKDVSDEELTREETLLNLYLAKKGLGERGYTLNTVQSHDVAGSIVEAAAGHDLIIMGTPLSANSNGTRVGRVIKTVMDKTDATMLIARSASTSLNPAFLSEDLVAIKIKEEADSVSDVVDKWFAENTFHANEFADIEKLVGLKQKQGLTISLGLPTLDEEQTIGNIIETIKTHLCDEYPLIDEIVVVDSSSTDRTVEIAKSYGVKVVNECDVLPGWGSKSGKGCALWKSLYILKGDIIAWIDTDIKNIHPRFIYGLIGPLIKYPRIKYVKGFYRRPIKLGDQLIETGGGRVTELTARPLINLFFPELSGIVQPLSGEYAGRREVLEKVGFYNGYGVEVGLLINILEHFGLDVIGQVDLIERIHHNQSLASLSKMSFAIIQVVIENLERRHRVHLLREINKTMKLIKHEPSQFYLELKAIEETMRPPMITVSEYQEIFKSAVADVYPRNLEVS